MGSWGTGTFDNDTAVDWTYGLEKSSDLGYVEAAIDSVLAYGSTKSVPSHVGERAIAAADTLLRLQGEDRDHSAYTETVDVWVQRHPLVASPELIAKTRRALLRVTTPPSDLLELWQEGEDDGEWTSGVEEIAAALKR